MNVPLLTDEVLAAMRALLPANTDGVALDAIASALGLPRHAARSAADQLNESGAAYLIRVDRVLRLVPAGHLVRGKHVCAVCRKLYARKWKAVTCSRSCAVALSWRDEKTRETRKASIKLERQTPEAKERVARINHRRWNQKPGERERLSEWNRRRWADPATKADLSAKIQRAQFSPENRRRISEIRRQAWRDPNQRKKMIEGIKRAKSTPEARALFSRLLRERWQDPLIRPKFLAAVRRSSKKATAVAVAKRKATKP